MHNSDRWRLLLTHESWHQKARVIPEQSSQAHRCDPGTLSEVHWGPQVHRWLRGTEDMPGCLQREPYPYSYCQQCRLSQWYGESFLWYSVEWNKEHKGHRGLILQKSYYILHLSLRELKSQLVKRETKWWIKVPFCTQILSHRRAGHQILIPNIRNTWW